MIRTLKPVFLFVTSLPVFISDARCQQVDQFNAAIRKHFRYIDSVRYKDDDTIRSILIGFMLLSRDRKVCFISWYTRQGVTLIEFATMVFYNDSKGKFIQNC